MTVPIKILCTNTIPAHYISGRTFFRLAVLSAFLVNHS